MPGLRLPPRLGTQATGWPSEALLRITPRPLPNSFWPVQEGQAWKESPR